MSDNKFLNKFSNKVFVIAEAGVNHNGNFEMAKKLVDVAANAKADAIKFQTFKAEECAGKFAETADYQRNNEVNNQYELLKSLELPFSDFEKLKNYAESRNLCFLSTPDGSESLDFLCEINVDAIKIASGEITNIKFLEIIAKKKFPVILSTGMSTYGEIQTAVEQLSKYGSNDIMLLHCTTSYPTIPSEVNISVLPGLKSMFKFPVGYSDHTIGNEASIMAVALGAEIIEKHITLDNQLSGPDHKASMPPDKFIDFVKAIRKASNMLGDTVKKKQLSEEETSLKVRRGLVAKRNIARNEILTVDMVAFKRPGIGIQPNLIDEAMKRIVLKNLKVDEPICWENLGGKS